MTNKQLQQTIEAEEKALEEFLQRANQEATFRRGRIAALKDMLSAEETSNVAIDSDGNVGTSVDTADA